MNRSVNLANSRIETSKIIPRISNAWLVYSALSICFSGHRQLTVKWTQVLFLGTMNIKGAVKKLLHGLSLKGLLSHDLNE